MSLLTVQVGAVWISTSISQPGLDAFMRPYSLSGTFLERHKVAEAATAAREVGDLPAFCI